MEITMVKLSKNKPKIEQCTINGKLNYVNFLYNDKTDTYLIVYSTELLEQNDMKNISQNDICNICINQDIDIYDNQVTCSDFFTSKN